MRCRLPRLSWANAAGSLKSGKAGRGRNSTPMAMSAMSPKEFVRLHREPTHRVAVLSTFMFPAPNIKSQPVHPVPMNAKVAVAGGDGRFAKLDYRRDLSSRLI